VFGAFLLFALAGLGINYLVLTGESVGASHDSPLPSQSTNQRSIWVILILTIILSVLAYLYYNSEFLQLQGRYMYPLLIPVGIILALGLDGWRRIFKLAWWFVPLIFFALAVFDVWLLWRVIVPNLS
jgi:hypothetical protein